MLFTTLSALAFAAIGLTQSTMPAGYHRVYMTSNVDTTFVIVPKARTAGSAIVVYVIPKSQNSFCSGLTAYVQAKGNLQS